MFAVVTGARTGRRVFVNFNDQGDEKQEIKLQRPNIHNLLEAVHYIISRHSPAQFKPAPLYSYWPSKKTMYT